MNKSISKGAEELFFWRVGLNWCILCYRHGKVSKRLKHCNCVERIIECHLETKRLKSFEAMEG